MEKKREFEDLAVELIGIEGTVNALSLLVKPKETIDGGSTITERTLEGVFYQISMAIERIADDLNCL